MKPGKPRSRSVPVIFGKLSFPVALALCVACFYLGCIYGGKPLAAVPDIRGSVSQKVAKAAEKAASATDGTGVTTTEASVTEASQKVAETAEEGDSSRRQLNNQEPKAPVTGTLAEPLGHGATGENFVSVIPYQVLSWAPRAYLYPNFAPPEKCDEIVAQARLYLTPSGLALRKGETADSTKDIRTSSGCFLSSAGNPNGALAWVEQKMAKAAMVPVTHGEAYNILRYEVGQKYNSHYDTFNPEEYGPQSSNRIASFLLYLTEPEEGGETMFPFEAHRNMNIGYDFKDCIGLTVRPRKGDALLFWSMHTNGTIDKTSLHGSCPVKKGEKWVATKWIRDKPTRML
eukprot:TRINITY_DN15060_c0_g1_i1.p1 TRINITY_DN15060_c0_g1~~TRINITY_DN15060_c0_g1_i1.p1  ORF type:complete len:344 (+),score=58.17 TRINITY_DN15060_c0_g1_i1:418-1449(+)